jgi:hypothetical protein
MSGTAFDDIREDLSCSKECTNPSSAGIKARLKGPKNLLFWIVKRKAAEFEKQLEKSKKEEEIGGEALVSKRALTFDQLIFTV